jgi:protein TonB
MFLLGALILGRAEDPVYKVGGDVVPPKLLFKVEPAYTAEARTAGVEGSVLLDAVITAEGKASKVAVFRSTMRNKETGEAVTDDHGLGGKAVEAAVQWRFRPGEKEGKPVNVHARIEVNFRLQ